MKRKVVAFISIVSLLLAAMAPMRMAEAASIVVDGKVSEWGNVPMQTSNNDNVAKWAVAKDEEYLYFYIQQNGGNQYGLPVTNTWIDIDYASGVKNNKAQIRFAGMLSLKDAWYGDIAGALQAYEPSQEAKKYEIEVAVPLDYFAEEDFVLHYCGASVDRGDIMDIRDAATPEPTEAVYNGIIIDGTFTDWDAVDKTEVNGKAVTETAMIFDGDYVYIYIKEPSDGAATWSGESNNGKFTIYTDLGRNTTFKLNTDSIEGIKGAKVSHSNCQYEISIPASAIKQYKETISFGYYMQDEMLIKDVANMKQDSSGEEKEFTGISYDGVYSDWDYYPHQLVQYSTSGGVGEDAEAALYQDGTTLYGHVLSTLHRNEKEFQPFTIRVNEKDDTAINFRLVAVDQDGNINMDAQLDHLKEGTYEFYLWDLNSGSTAKNINDKDAPIYGQMFLTVRMTAEGVSLSDEVEYKVDLEKLAEHFQMEVSDMKMIQAQYINIGQEWVSIAGTSTGALMGISLCGFSVLAVWLYRKRKNKVTC